MVSHETYVQALRRRVGHDPLILIGCNVIIERADGRILMQRRSEGSWGLPGGQLELGETLEQAAAREVREETSLSISGLELLGVFSGPDYFFTLKNLDQLFAVTVLYRAIGFEGVPYADGVETLDLMFADPNQLPEGTEREYQTYVGRYLEQRAQRVDNC